MRKIRRAIIKILVLFFSIFYDKKYLKGRWFNDNFCGIRWCFRSLWWQKIRRYNASCKFPVSPFTKVSINGKIVFDPDNLDNFQGYGNYYQCENACIYIGKGTYIAQNTGIITANHDIYILDEHTKGKDVVIGDYCWIGMNSVILPGVVLGNHTIVGAGAVVTKGFPEGNCVIAGNPAKIIKKSEPCDKNNTKE